MEDIKKIENGGTQVVAEFTVRMFSNGAVNIHGPIDNFFLFRSVMNAAERAVLDHIQKKAMQQPNIIVPDMRIPAGPIRAN